VLRSALSCEHLITDQAEAQVLIENAEGFADFVVAGEPYRLDVVKHARLSGFFKPVSPHQTSLHKPLATRSFSECTRF
jgi:hypothetical protein